MIASLARTFELHGFANIETRAVEPLDRLAKGGEIDKEIYVLRRMQATDAGDDTGLGMHFDLTVPFARYVLENAGHLEFPFRRFQIQPAWRGERPQEGRYRQFTQADIDIVGRDELPFHHDVEVMRVMVQALGVLPLPPLSFQVNNRKLIQGFYRGLGIPDVMAAIRTIDKLDKRRARRRGRPPRRRRRGDPRAGPALSGAGDHPGLRQLGRRAGEGPRRQRRPARPRPRRALGRAGGLRRRRGRTGDGRGEPPDRARSRLLHRHRRRDLHGGLRTAEVGRWWRTLRRARRRRPYDVPGRGHLLRPLAHAGAADLRRCARRQPGGAQRGPGRPGRRGEPPGQRADRRRAATPRHPLRGRREPPEVRSSDPSGRAARHPVRLVPWSGWRRRRLRPGQGHPLRRPGRRRRRPPGRRPTPISAPRSSRLRPTQASHADTQENPS